MNTTRLSVVFLLATTATAYADPTPQIETILDKLEARGKAIDDIHCQVHFKEEDRISNDVTKRYGTILFKRKSPNPIFLITFNKLISEGEVIRRKAWYAFDGRYFLEAKQRSKSIIRRDLAPPGTEIDLFSIDKAPFPLPFGQKKAEILHHFDLQLAPPDEDDPTDTDHLICTPKPHSHLTKDHSRIDFYISKSLHLPVRIITTANPPDKVLTADFPDLSEESINTDLPDKRFKLPAETRKYAVANER